MKRLLVAVMLSLAGVAHAADPPPLPKQLPPFGAGQGWPKLEIARRTLANGLTVWVVPRAGVPKLSVELTVLGGSACDPPDLPALSDLLATLLSEGTTTRSSQQLAEAWQAIGGAYAAYDSPDGFALSATALSAHSDELLGLLADVALHPTFPDAEVALAKTNALETLKVYQANPAWQAYHALGPPVFGTHPYADTDPTVASIDASTPALLRAEHARRFRPDRALLVFVGRVDPEAAFALAQAHFGDWRAIGPPPAELPVAPLVMPPAHLLVQRDASVQASIHLGAPSILSSSPGWMALKVADTIFGHGFASRLVVDVREEKGYSYHPYSALGTFRSGAMIDVGADVRNEVTGAALAEIDVLLSGMATIPPTEEELTGAKRLLVGGSLVANERQTALAAWLSEVWVIGLPLDYVTTYAERVNAVTAKQVTDVSAKYLAPARASVVIVGDERAIGAQLKPFGDFKIVAP